jgi:hypothetical protein
MSVTNRHFSLNCGTQLVFISAGVIDTLLRLAISHQSFSSSSEGHGRFDNTFASVVIQMPVPFMLVDT